LFIQSLKSIHRKNNFPILLVILYILAITSFNYAQQSIDYKPPVTIKKQNNQIKDTTEVKQQDLFTPPNRLKFGYYLYSENDYLRAAGEFKEYLRNYDNDTVRLKYALCYFRIGRFAEAADNFKTLFFNSALSEKARLLFYESHFFCDDYRTFRDLTDKENYMPMDFRKEVDKLNSASYFLDNSFLPDTATLFKPFDDSVHSKLADFYYKKKYNPQKSITTTVLLSAVIPGAGKIYTGEIGDGVTSLIATVVSAYLAVTNFQNDHKFRGWLFSGLTAFFYAGNIYGSAASAQIYNARIRFNLQSEIKLYFEQRNYFLPVIGF
jgi:TM2 domain-containing membrane protein YozV